MSGILKLFKKKILFQIYHKKKKKKKKKIWKEVTKLS